METHALIYTEEILDRATGEVITINKGDWITVTEFGEMMNVGPYKIRSVLRELDFVGVEGSGRHQRHRISLWATREGLGKRLHPSKKTTRPFDVIGPAGREWLKPRWADALKRVEDRQRKPGVAEAKAALTAFQVSRGRENMPVQEAVCWLADHFSGLGQADVASILDITQQLVSRYQNLQAKQRREARYVFGEFDDEEGGR